MGNLDIYFIGVTNWRSVGLEVPGPDFNSGSDTHSLSEE